MQMLLKLNEDKSISKSQYSANIYIGERDADSILILFPQKLGNISLRDMITTLHYVNSEGAGDVIRISFSDSLYRDEFLQKEIDIKSDMTSAAGAIKLWFEISDDSILCKTDIVSFSVNPHEDSAEYTPTETPQLFNEYKIQMQQLINTAEMIKEEILETERRIDEKLQIMIDALEEWEKEKTYGS